MTKQETLSKVPEAEAKAIKKGEKPASYEEKIIIIDSLEKLKKELNLSSLDTSSDEYFRDKQINLEISRTELDKLKTSMIGTDSEKLEKLKKIIDEKEQIKAKTGKEVDKLKKEVDKFPDTPEGLERLFQEFEKNGISEIESDKHQFINYTLSRYIYGKGLYIRNEGNLFSKDLQVIDKTGKVQKEYSEVLKKYLKEDDFRLDIAFRTSIGAEGKNMEKRVKDIVATYNIRRKPEEKINLDETDKAVLNTQIANSDLDELNKTLLFDYVRNKGKYKSIEQDPVYQQRITDTNNRMGAVDAELKRRGIELSRESTAELVRNPLKYAGKLLGSMNPFSSLSLIIVSIWALFGKPFDSKFGKLLTAVAGYGVAEGFGLTEKLAQSIEGKYDKEIGAGAESVGVAMTWAWGKIKNLPPKASSTGKELAERVSFWYEFSNFEYTDIKGNKADLIDSNFEELYSKTKSGYGNSLSRSDGKQIEQKDLTSLTAKLNKLHNDGIKKYKNEQAFFTAIKGMNIAQVIDNVTDEKPKEATPNSPSSAPSGTPAVAPNVPQSRIPGVGQTPVTAPQNTPSQTPKISRIPNIN